MAFRAIRVGLVLASLLTAGCGTVANLVRSRPEEGGRAPFGGVKQDVSCLNRAANGELGAGAHARPETEQYPQMALVLFCAVDLPLSLIGDLVTWPYTAAYSFINQPVPTPGITQAPAEGGPPVDPPEPLTIPRKFP